MATSRLFLANLPPDTKEKDLKKIVKDYGEVLKVELKTKENLVDPENLKVIAFVTLKINEADAQYCINELNWLKIKGQQIKVSLAKESFLDRLKREREETEAAAAGADTSTLCADASTELLMQNVENTRKTFAEDLDLEDDDEISPSLLITKRKAAKSLQNGKIVIQSCDNAPIHVINAKQPTRQLDAKSTAADQKRKQSLIKKKNLYQQNKSAIQHSLAGLDTNASKKIKFSDAEDDDECTEKHSFSQQASNIFGSDDEGEDGDNMGFDLKPEYFGKKGEKLLKLQSGQSLDPRFKIDAKFVAEDGEDVDDGIEIKEQENEEGNERDWQMGILEQVVGTKIDSTQAAASKAAKNKKMLRFDPMKNEHQKFLRTNENETNEKVFTKHKKAKQHETQNESHEAAPEVSKEVFYMVTDSLTQSLKTRGDGFSLLNMFGSAGTQSEEQRVDNLKKVTHEKILLNKMDRSALNPFSYDSSSDSDDEQVPNAEDCISSLDQKQGKLKNKQKQKVKVVVETFFFQKHDVRLKEGAKFFRYDKQPESVENYEDVRNRLKMLIRTKISKSKKTNARWQAQKKNK